MVLAHRQLNFRRSLSRKLNPSRFVYPKASTAITRFVSGLKALSLWANFVDGAALGSRFQPTANGTTIRGASVTTTHGAPTRRAWGYSYDGVDDGHEWTISNVAGARTSFVWCSGATGGSGNILHLGIINSVSGLSGYHVTQTETNAAARTFNGATAIVTPTSTTTQTGVPECHMMCATDTNAGTAGSLKLYIDGEAALSAVSGAVNAVSLTQVKCGFFRSSVPIAYSKTCVACWLVFSKALTAGEVASVRALVESTIAPRQIVVCEGDSLTASVGWPTYYGDQSEVWGLVESQNLATGGHTSVDVISGYAASITPLAPTKPKTKTFALMIGANDIANLTSDSAATIFARIQSLWSTARAEGWRVAAFTILNGAGVATRSAVFDSINASIRAASSEYDILVDADAWFTSLVGSATYYTNLTYFDVDQIHLTTTGKTSLASFVATKINTV